MADMLELECPGCNGLLELDSGFAGGVCRCSMCGTLMTVPADPSQNRAERLSRPDSPDGRPDAPASTRAETPAAAPEEGEELVAIDLSAEDAAAPAEETGVETFVTDTGKVVRIDRDTVIPTAPKKRAVIRATTAVLFFAVVGVVLAMMAGAVWLMIKPAPPVDTSHEALQRFTYNRDANPWTLEGPNVLGMSLGPKAAVIVDASDRSSGWLNDVKSAIAAGLTRADSGAEVALIYATADGVDEIGMQGIGGLSINRLTNFQEGFEAKGEPRLRQAVEAAIDMEPAAVILVIGRRVDSQTLDSMRSLMEGAEVRLDVLAVGRDDPTLDQLSRDLGGRYQFISSGTLEAWRNAAP